MMTNPALGLREISKRFGEIVALEKASLVVRPGSIHALLGENGAGKTTLMRIAFGLIRPDSGSIEIGGVTKSFRSPSEAIASGLGMVHQQFSLIPGMTVAENVALGGRGRFSPRDLATRISEVGDRTGLKLNPETLVASLGSAERQKLEIIRSLAHDARVLILDEPTAVLTPRDIGELFRQLRSFADGGGAVVLITHKLDDAIANADEVTVLRRGRVALTAPMSRVDRLSLTSAMLGFTPEPSATGYFRPSAASIVASLRDIVPPVEIGQQPGGPPISLDLRTGEILGVAALNGRAASLLRTLAGRTDPASGSIKLPMHIAFVPENRLEEAIVPEFDLAENFALKGLGTRDGLMHWTEIEDYVSGIIRDFDVKATGPRTGAATLSGGNQQRFVLGRELHDDPPLLILENPTQGLDVQAAAAVHARVRAAAGRGAAVVFYSSDLDELAQIAHRVLVVKASEFAFSEPEKGSIGQLLLDT